MVYYQSSKSASAGILTALTNRIGDVLIIFSIVLIFPMGSWGVIGGDCVIYFFCLSFCLVLGSTTKRAQFPFSSWLPAAMSAPTPVSALVHSSTLVTAGVYLLIRFYPLICGRAFIKDLLLLTSVTTIIIAGFSALYEYDIKKVIALSTLSQLGVIMSSVSLSMPSVAFFHLVSHALFKSLLFIGAGYLIINNHHSQDLRFSGSRVKQSPLIGSCVFVASVALMGLPFLSGFYSKDLIIENFLLGSNPVIGFLYVIGTVLTSCYSFRFIFLVYKNMGTRFSFSYFYEGGVLPILILGVFSVVGGSFIG